MEENITEKKKLGIIPLIIIVIIIIISGTYSYMRFIEPKLLNVREYPIINKKIPDSMNGFKIVHFSDIHFGRNINEPELEKIIQKINELKPDILIFTGDLLDEKINITENSKNNIKEILKKTTAKLGKYAIAGDNDYKDIDFFKTTMQEANFEILENKNIPIYYKSETPIYISGISSIKQNEYDLIKSLEKETNEETFQIVMTHEPILFDELKREVDVVLAGHNLGGEISLPFIGGIIKIDNTKDYINDFYKNGNAKLYISNGLGTEKTNLRFMNVPSISLYRLYNK